MSPNAIPIRTTAFALNPNAIAFVPFTPCILVIPSGNIIKPESEEEYDFDSSQVLNSNDTPACPTTNILNELLIGSKNISSGPTSDVVDRDNETVNENIFKILKDLRIKNHNKFDALKTIIPGNIDVFVITETKLDASFETTGFMINGFCQP